MKHFRPKHVGHVLEWVRTIAPLLILLRVYGIL